MSLDLSEDYLLFDNLTSVTLKFRDGSPDELINGKALRRAVTFREAMASNGKVTTSDVHWHIPVDGLNKTPTLGDKIVHGSTEWTVLVREEQTLSTRLRFTCRDIAITAGLDTVIKIQSSTTQKEQATNAIKLVYSDLHTNVRAKIQFVSGTRDRQSGRDEMVRKWAVSFEQTFAFSPNYRIVGPDGVFYKPVELRDPDDIGKPFVVICEAYP